MNGQAQLAAVVLAGFFSQGADDNSTALPVAESEDARSKPMIVEISSESCAFLASRQFVADAVYQPGVDVRGEPVVSADYQPGVDVRGNPVVKASFSEITYKLRPVYEFSVRISLPGNNPLFDETRVEVARVSFEPESGRVMLDDQELVWLHKNALKTACDPDVRDLQR